MDYFILCYFYFLTAVTSSFTHSERNQSVAALIWLFGWQYLTLFDIHGSLLPQIYSIYNLTLSLAVHHCQTMIVGAFSTEILVLNIERSFLLHVICRTNPGTINILLKKQLYLHGSALYDWTIAFSH